MFMGIFSFKTMACVSVLGVSVYVHNYLQDSGLSVCFECQFLWAYLVVRQ